LAMQSTRTLTSVLDYATINKIKTERFGRTLEEFKAIYEKPLLDAYNAVNLIKSTYAKRQARYLLRDVPTRPVLSVDVKKKKFQKFLRMNEEKLEETGLSHLKRDLDDKDWFQAAFRGVTPSQRKQRESMIRSMMTHERFRELPNKDYDKLGNHLDTLASHTKDTPLHSQWEFECDIPENDLAQIISKELQAEGFEITTKWSDRWHDQRDRSWSNPHTMLMAKIATQGTGFLPTDAIMNRPALLNPSKQFKKHKNRFVRMQKVSEKLPIGFESTHYPLDNDMYDLYFVRKCTMYVKLCSLMLPKPVRTRLLQVAGHFYDPRKDLLILKYQKKRTFSANKQYVVRLLGALLREAWKADLNFIPSEPDRLQPHQVIDEELKRAPELVLEATMSSFDSISAVQHFTVFQMTSHPSSNASLAEKKEKVGKFLANLGVSRDGNCAPEFHKYIHEYRG